MEPREQQWHAHSPNSKEHQLICQVPVRGRYDTLPPFHEPFCAYDDALGASGKRAYSPGSNPYSFVLGLGLGYDSSCANRGTPPELLDEDMADTQRRGNDDSGASRLV